MSKCKCFAMNYRRRANGTSYASDSLKMLHNNLDTPDYIKKVDAFLKYAKHDPDMVRSSAMQPTSHLCLFVVPFANKRRSVRVLMSVIRGARSWTSPRLNMPR
jgi:hypothetical protein